eukprot:1775570-Karenia_brevis.AAC.1
MDTSQDAFEQVCNPENPEEDEWTSVHGTFLRLQTWPAGQKSSAGLWALIKRAMIHPSQGNQKARLLLIRA